MKKASLIFLALMTLSACQNQTLSNQIPETIISANKNIKQKPALTAGKMNVFTNNVSPSNQKIVELLKKSSKDLYLISESDEAFKVFVWSNQAGGNITPARILNILKHNPRLKAERQKEGLSWLADYATIKYWTDGGYSPEKSRQMADSYKKFISDMAASLKDIQLFLVDDPSNLDYPNYNPDSSDFSGAVEFYLFGKYGNDIIGVSSILVWT